MRVTKQRKVLKTADQVIAAYGGPARCARKWDRTTAAVCQWRRDGIPPGYHYRMADDLESNGFIVDGRELGWL